MKNILMVVVVSQVYTYVKKTHQTVCFKYMQFIVHQLYLNKAVKYICTKQHILQDHTQTKGIKQVVKVAYGWWKNKIEEQGYKG